MNTRALRFRLLLWYAAWLGLVFAVSGVLLYFGLRRYLENSLATTQHRRAERIGIMLTRPPGAAPVDIRTELTAVFAPEASGRFLRVTRTDGTVLYQSGVPHDQSFVPDLVPRSKGSDGARTIRLDDGVEMVLALVSAAPNLLIQAGESLEPALAELRRLLLGLAAASAVAAALALGGGFQMVRRALAPVEDITRTAERISSRNLGDRLPVPATGDEFQHLSESLNRMIARLDEALQHNRRFLVDASHELRTPLTILQGELENLVQRGGAGDDDRETFGNLLSEVERLARIVENLFALSRLDAGQAQTEYARFDLARLVATTADQMCLLAEDKGLTIVSQTDQPVWVDGDRARLKQVIVNLLDNAIKYTPSGGEVRLRVYSRPGESLCEVADNGIGIPAEALPRVFDRFFRVDPGRSRDLGGAGIGLSIVKAICHAHGGRVEVESGEGRGSLFRVILPASVPPGNSPPVALVQHAT